MTRLSKTVALLLPVLVASLALACKQQASEKAAGKPKDSSLNAGGKSPGNGVGGTGDNSSGGDEEDEDEDNERNCKKSSSKDDDEWSLAGDGPGLNLADSVTYEDIESIIETKCVSCHDSSGTDPDLSTYSKFVKKASASLEQIESGDMPKKGSPQLTAAEKKKIKSWAADGKLEKPEEEDSSGGSSSPACDEDNEDEQADDGDEGEEDSSVFDKEAAFKELLNPKELGECHDDGKVYDRGKKVCHRSELAKTYKCDAAGIVSKFKSMGITISAQGEKIVNFEKYEIDQCGEFEGDPVVFFYEKVEEGDEIGLNIKVLCKKSSPACVR